MKRLFQTLLLWFIIAALPLQGLAAAAMVSCDPAQHAAVSGAQAASLHQHGDGGHEHHARAAVQSEQADAGSQADAPAGQHASTHCATCTAAPAAPLAWAMVRAVSEPVSIAPASLAGGYIPASLERPPRRISS